MLRSLFLGGLKSKTGVGFKFRSQPWRVNGSGRKIVACLVWERVIECTPRTVESQSAKSSKTDRYTRYGVRVYPLIGCLRSKYARIRFCHAPAEKVNAGGRQGLNHTGGGV